MRSAKHGRINLAGVRRKKKRRVERRIEKLTAFNWSTYKSRSASLIRLRASKARADALLETSDGYSERVHWQVLTALCPDLIEQSSLSYTPSGLCRRLIRLPSRISQQMARLLVNCAYGELHFSLNPSDLDDFFAICLDFRIDHGLCVCLNFAKRILDPLNCVYMFKLAVKYRHLKLKCAAYSMMRSNFKQVLQMNPDFHQLEHQQLQSLLNDNALRVGDDEELAWLAILRWLEGKPLAQARLTNLYNRMVAGPQDVLMNIFQGNASQRVALDQPLANRRHSIDNGQQHQPPIRISMNFYSPGYCNHTQRSRRLSGPISSSAPLKRFLANHQNEITELQLLALIKCLRYMRFKSTSAFDVIAGHRLVSSSSKLSSLVNTMRIRYKLRHKISLSSEDKQSVSVQHLAQLKRREARRAKRLVDMISLMLESNSTNQQAGAAEDPAEMAASEPLEVESKQINDERLNDLFERCGEPRVPSSVGFLFGGWQDGTVSKTIWTYDFIYDRWYKLNIRLPGARALHASCVSPSSGHIYIFGGTDGHKILNTVWRFNPHADVCPAEKSAGARFWFKQQVTSRSNLLRRSIEWPTKCERKRLIYRFKQLCPMSERRCHLAGVFHSDGRIYALGGHNGAQRLRSAEWYDTKSNQWHRIADMMIARSDAAACSHESKIYIAGGHISDQLIQSSVEFYKSSDNTWTFAAPMIIPRMSFCLVSYKGQLIALGGTNGLAGGDEVISVTRSVERYDQSSGSWSFCAPMAQKRCSFAAMIIENKLIAVGGHGGYRRLKRCEILRIGQFSATNGSENEIQAPLDRLRANYGPTTPAISHQVGRRRANSVPTIGSSSSPRQLRGAANQLNVRIFNRNNQRLDEITFRGAFKWMRREDLPERRSAFSVAVVPELRNARDYTYFGSTIASQRRAPKKATGAAAAGKGPSPLIRQPSRWRKFKLIKRRKLMKHLKIALVVSIVILML